MAVHCDKRLSLVPGHGGVLAQVSAGLTRSHLSLSPGAVCAADATRLGLSVDGRPPMRMAHSRGPKVPPAHTPEVPALPGLLVRAAECGPGRWSVASRPPSASPPSPVPPCSPGGLLRGARSAEGRWPSPSPGPSLARLPAASGAAPWAVDVEACTGLLSTPSSGSPLGIWAVQVSPGAPGRAVTGVRGAAVPSSSA